MPTKDRFWSGFCPMPADITRVVADKELHHWIGLISFEQNSVGDDAQVVL